MNRRRRHVVVLGLLVIAAAGVVLLRLLIDRDPHAGTVALRWPAADYASFRVTATLVGAIVGASLATAGVMLQALLRNVLASPFILGVSSGAGLGYMIAAYVGYGVHAAVNADVPTTFWSEQIAFWGQRAGPSMLGALVTLALVFVLARRNGRLDPVTLILIGVIVATMGSAGMMFFQHMVDTGVLRDFTRWLAGRIDEGTPPGVVGSGAVIALAGVAVAVVLGRAMDAAMLGDDEAESVGLRLGRLRVILFVVSGVLTALTVALAGPIGFVGLVAPHVARIALGPTHRVLVVGAALAGIVLVVGADAARQAIDFGAGRMPIGIFTAMIGGPMFIWLLQRRRW